MRVPAFLSALTVAFVAIAAQASETVELRAGEHDGYGRIAIEWPKPVAFDAKIDGQTLTIHFARPFTASLDAVRHNLDHYIASAAQSADGTTITAKLTAPVQIKTSTVNQNIIAIDLLAHPTAETKTATTKAETKAAEKGQSLKGRPVKDQQVAVLQAAPQAAPLAVVPPAGVGTASAAIPAAVSSDTPATEATPSKSSDVAMPQVVTEAGQTSLRFDWPANTGAAVYRRGAALWLVFSATSKLDLDGLRAHTNGLLSAIDKVPAGNGTALRLIAADGINPSVRRAGNSWIIDLRNKDASTDAPIIVDPRPSAAQPTVELHVHGASNPLSIKDPVLGDTLIVVPVSELGRGVDNTRSFVDFRVLPTVQGVVLRPNTNDLTVQTDADSIDVSRPKGLVLSGDHDRMLGSTVADPNRLFNFAAWQGPEGKTFIERRSQLEHAVAAAQPTARTPSRLELARFYFANQFGAETLGVLEQVERDDVPATTDRTFQALKGAACFMTDDLACAQKQFGLATLDNDVEASLWRGQLAAETADWNNAARQFIGSIGLLPSYPKALRDRFALKAAEAFLETDRGSAAGPLIDLVEKDSPTQGDAAMAQYLAGRREQQLGQLEPALEQWVAVSASGDRQARARALYARAMALYDGKKASRIDTINTLDALRFSWRGDAFEFTLLRQLGELQLAEGDADDAIEALREAATYFPDYPAAKDVSKEAADAFANIFIGKSVEDLAPIKALALYTEYHDLEPAGDRRDQIVRKLIDRLVAVDLLDQATALLDDQVKNHFTGVDKARGATQLALLRLMNRQPDAAIAALDIDLGGNLTNDLARQRIELRARALTDLDKAAGALKLLASDNSVDAARLRADIYWHQQDWKDAAKVFADLAGAPPAQGPLGVELSRIVLAWAAALTLDSDEDGIAKLRNDWGPAIAGTQTAQAFNLITDDSSSAASAGGSAADVAKRIAEIGTLQNFMSAYRQRLASDGLNAIN